VPVISRFLGISIAMYYLDHEPPHFHVVVGSRRATVRLRDGAIHGPLPRRAASHVLEWLALHREELAANWESARRGEPLRPVAPLG
jgi:hypothetical protein